MMLTSNQYGKAEVRLVRVDRQSAEHSVTDLNVSTTLRGDLAATHLTGDNANVLPTDSQKNTVYAFARDGVGEIEDFAQKLAHHFVTSQPTISWARTEITQYFWHRLGPHSFQRAGGYTRAARVTVERGREATVESGLTGLTLMNTTDSEFTGFIRDAYTTLPEAKDRILATEVDAWWSHQTAQAPWGSVFESVRSALVDAFTQTYSLSLQQTLYAMGERVLDAVPGIVEVQLSLPNKHHLPVDLSPFGRDNPGEVFVATDRPYGLIQGTVTRP